ncbi:tol-pal system-associated acyl-CoA thioesterase [Rhizobiaceae bacterium BDR2-2]|uniref:Tol-pal system-associated acyl-CoA thioesterase n=1 Tax=Ectorhizobium quercum TaxID=2965071 RepID=A0AAE3SUK3_9HYPH|nr:tol-pal system-associated acyl-CoA thioesterase [Ectorhizobium quercum]MCX8996773.1 tol-pal system-associated acyl-CoA thioesterase [Ectorhizobium quercum]
MTEHHVPLSGAFDAEGRHRLTQRVYYEDTDFSGRVYHARYLHFLERGRTDYLRCLGVEQGQLADDEAGLVFVVGRMEIDFRSPALMDDVLTVLTGTTEVAGARMVIEQEIRARDKVVVSARVRVAAISKAGRPRRLPPELAARLLGR